MFRLKCILEGPKAQGKLKVSTTVTLYNEAPELYTLFILASIKIVAKPVSYWATNAAVDAIKGYTQTLKATVKANAASEPPYFQVDK